MTTLVISTILLIASSLITLFSSKAIIIEQKISANHYRSNQAFYAADAQLNQFTSRLNEQLVNTKLNLASANKSINMKAYSDDKSLQQNISALFLATPIAGNGMGKIVKFPLITRLGIDKTENLTIINSFAANSIWSGGEVFLSHYKSLFYEFSNTSNLGVDIVDKDFNLQHLSTVQFFENFLNESSFFIKQLAKTNDLYFSRDQVQQLDQSKGLVWLGDGKQDITLDNASLGTKEKPVFVIIDCSNNVFSTRGSITIYGLLYIRGDWQPSGEINVYGAVIVEGKLIKTENPELVKTQIEYDPSSLKPEQPLENTIASVIGSWKDF